MEYLPYIAVSVFVICLLTGVGALYYYNRFARIRTKIQEAQESISLFTAKRTNAVEALQPMADRLDTALMKDVHKILELERNLKNNQEPPGRASGSTELESLTKQLFKSLRSMELTAQISAILDQMERAEVELNGSRRYYNALVREHNILATGFPSALVAFLFRFKEIEYLQFSEGNEA